MKIDRKYDNFVLYKADLIGGKVQELNGILPTLIASIPVWVILLYFLQRSVKNRDNFERDVIKSFKRLQDTSSSQSTSLALLKKDIDHLNKSVQAAEIFVRQSEKMKMDLEICFKRLRALEDR